MEIVWAKAMRTVRHSKLLPVTLYNLALMWLKILKKVGNFFYLKYIYFLGNLFIYFLNNKVTHGCITVEIKLFLRQGVEAVNKPWVNFKFLNFKLFLKIYLLFYKQKRQLANKIDVQTQELYQLALFLQVIQINMKSYFKNELKISFI